MCFSPTASFGATAVLTATGVASMAYSRSLPQKALSGIPILFALQQFAEGILWLSLLHPEWAGGERLSTYSFLIFAQVVWPVYVPLVIWLLEGDSKRKRIIGWLTTAGAVFSAYALFAILYYPTTAVIEQHHIRYVLSFALAHKWYYGLLYFIPTILAPLLSSNKTLHWIGYLFLSSYIVARLLFHFYVISVWCFFGAIISIIILYIVRQGLVKKAAN